MNTTKNRGAARFAPETRLEPRTRADAPFRANLEHEFDRLKTRLLAAQLDLAENPALNAPLRRAANEAAALAWLTFDPLLVFPELFAEKLNLAMRQAERQARIYAGSPELVAA